MNRRIKLAFLIALALMAGGALRAQPGPLTPPPEREVKRLPMGTAPEAPPVPPEEIVHRFTEKEARYAEAFRNGTYKLTVRVVEYDAKGEAAGEARLVTLIYRKEDGQQYGRYLEEPPSTLAHAQFTVADLTEFAALPYFPLTPDQLFKYDVTYVGKQQVDEIDTYAFNVKPKAVDRAERRFEGLVWVDDRDFEIVKTYGRLVSEVVPNDPFKFYETYREVVEGMRLPTYVRSDGEMKAGDASVRLRLTLRYSDFMPPQKN